MIQYPIGTDLVFWVHKSQMLSYQPAVKKVITHYDGSNEYNHLPDGDFEAQAWKENGRLWSWEGNAIYTREDTGSPPSPMTYRPGEYDLRLAGHSDSLEYATLLRSKPFWLDRKLGFVCFLLIECDDEYDLLGKTNPQLYCEINCGEYYYLGDQYQGENGWSKTQAFVNLVFNGRIEFNEYMAANLGSIQAPPVPGLCTIRITQCVSEDYNVLGIRLNEITLAESAIGNRTKTITETKVSEKKYTAEHESTIFLGDSFYNPANPQETANNGRLNGSMRYNGVVNLTWVEAGAYQHNPNIPIDFRLTRKHALDRYENLSAPRQTITGTLRGVLDMGTVLDDVSNPGKSFLPTGWSFNDITCQYQGEWVEIWKKNQDSFLVDYEGNYCVDETGGKVMDYKF